MGTVDASDAIADGTTTGRTGSDRARADDRGRVDIDRAHRTNDENGRGMGRERNLGGASDDGTKAADETNGTRGSERRRMKSDGGSGERRDGRTRGRWRRVRRWRSSGWSRGRLRTSGRGTPIRSAREEKCTWVIWSRDRSGRRRCAS